MKPPLKEDVEPSELFLKLCEPRPSEVIDFPRKDRDGNPIGKIRIQVLRMEDHNKARLVATRALKESLKGFGVGDLDKNEMESDAVREVLGDLIAHELLCLACLSDKEQEGLTDDNGNPVYAKIFGKPSQIRTALTADETLVLFNAYRLVQYKYGPFESTLNDDGDIEAWVTRLKEGGSAFPLLVLPLPQLAELAFGLSEKISTVCQILESQRSILPPTLVSDLENCFMDMFSYGARLNRYTLKLEEISQQKQREIEIDSAINLAQNHKFQDTYER